MEPVTLRCQLSALPRLLIFRFCSNLQDFIRTPCLSFLRKLTFFKPLTSLPFVVLFTPNFHGKKACFCIYSSFMLYDNLFLLFQSLYNHLKLFPDFRLPPFILTPVIYYISELFPTSFLLGPPPFIWYLRVGFSESAYLH